MAIYQEKNKNRWTKDGRSWYFRVYYTDIDGKRKQKQSPKYYTKEKCIQEEKRFIEDMKEYEINYVDMSFKDLYRDYYIFQKDKVRESTLDIYALRYPYLDILTYIKIREFKLEHYETWKKNINKKDISTIYKNSILKFLKAMMNYGTKYHDLNFSKVYNRMTNFNNPNELPPEQLCFTYDEFKQFIEVEEDIKWQATFRILYYCGLRKGELRGLQWKDIDLERKTLSVRKQITDRCGTVKKFKFVVPKTQYSIRTLKMPEILVNSLKKAKLEAKQLNGFNENYFVAGDAFPISSNALADRKNTNCEKAGVKQIRLHDFRHSCASLLINKGANIQVVAKYLGHTKIEETLKTYSHLFISTLDEIINVIDTLEDNKTDD